MNRTRVLFASLALLTLLGGMIPHVAAEHDYNHRYMAYGRVLDSTGQPAQEVLVRVIIESRDARGSSLFGDPYITVQTDCLGYFHTIKERTVVQQELGWGRSLDWTDGGNKIHIHGNQYAPNGAYHIAIIDAETAETTWTQEYKIDIDARRSYQSVQVDYEVPASPNCANAPAFESTYLVMGTAQTEKGAEGTAPRHDAMTVPDFGEFHNVTVTITTPDGPRTMTVPTDDVGDYLAVFEDIDVTEDSVVSVKFNDVEESKKANLKYRATGIKLFEGEPAINPVTGKILLYVVIGVVLIGGGYWVFSTMKDKAELAKIREQSGRKRANK